MAGMNTMQLYTPFLSQWGWIIHFDSIYSFCHGGSSLSFICQYMRGRTAFQENKTHTYTQSHVCLLQLICCTPTVDFLEEPNHYSASASCCLTEWNSPWGNKPDIETFDGSESGLRWGAMQCGAAGFYSPKGNTIDPPPHLSGLFKSHIPPCLPPSPTSIIYHGGFERDIPASLWTHIYTRQIADFSTPP